LGFSGGQGVATSMGALSVLLPREAAISLAVALFFYLITRRLSLSGWFAKPQNFGGFAGYIAFVFLTFWIWEPWPPRIALIMVSLALLVRQIEKLKKGGAYLADLIQQVLKRGGE
jgi:glycerol-3-phosphate acyltransferase PlsY